METRFNEFKEDILKRAKEANACRPEYARAFRSETFAELMQVIKDNFHFAAEHKIIEPTIIEAYKEEFNANMIWCNVSCSAGYLLVDSATVEASGSATVEASGSATVKASGSATVEAYDSATVEAYDRATVEAYDRATVEAYGSATVEAYDSATVEAYDRATVEAYGSATVEAYGSATVEAYDSAYVTSYYTIECQLSGNAIYRIRESNTIKYSSDSIAFERG